MIKNLLFIQGAGEGAYEEDKKLVECLQETLGLGYEVLYPKMPEEGDANYSLWKNKFVTELNKLDGQIILVGHSVGASILLKYLTEGNIREQIIGIFLLANPFWGGDGWIYKGYEELELPKGFSARLPKDIPIFFYHCQDDKIVPFNHLDLYAKTFPQATVREFKKGGHQFDNSISFVTNDIKNLTF